MRFVEGQSLCYFILMYLAHEVYNMKVNNSCKNRDKPSTYFSSVGLRPGMPEALLED